MRITLLLLLIHVPLLAVSPEQLALANRHFDQGLYQEAVTEYTAALPAAGSEAQRAEIVYRLATTQSKLADFAAAEKRYREALALFRSEGDSAGYALSLAGLGEIYRAQYRPEDALALEHRDLAALRNLGLGQSPAAAAVLNITGAILFEQRRYREAERDMREAARIIGKTRGTATPDYAMSLNNLGAVVMAQGRAEEAETLLTEALRIRREHFGPSHPVVADTLLGLSSVLNAQKRYEEAEKACRESIVILARFFPSTHPNLINASRTLALIAHEAGHPAAALDILEETVARTRPNPESLQLLALYSRYLQAAGRKQRAGEIRAEAEQLARQSSRPSQSRATVSVDELSRPE